MAKVGLVPGTLLTPQHLAQTRVIPPGQSIVAVPLKTGQAPRIDTGDEVLVVPTGGSTSDSGGSRPLVAGGTASTRTARVQGIDRDESGDLIVSLLVEESAAPFIAAAASTGDISLVLRSSRP